MTKLKIIIEKLSLEQITALMQHFEQRDRARLMSIDHLVAWLHQAAAADDPAKAGRDALARWADANNDITQMGDAEIERIVLRRPKVPTLEQLRAEARGKGGSDTIN